MDHEDSQPTAEQASESNETIMNNDELAALRESGFVVETIDMDNEEVWVRG